MKKCSICNLEKSLEEFYSQKKKSQVRGEYIYYNPECKECTKQKSYKWRENNPEKYRESMRKTDANEFRLKHHLENSRRQRESGEKTEWDRNNKDKIFGYSQKRNYLKHIRLQKLSGNLVKNTSIMSVLIAVYTLRITTRNMLEN